MNVDKACKKIATDYEEFLIVGHNQDKERFEVACSEEASPDFWLNVASFAIKQCAEVTETSGGKILGDFICNLVIFGDLKIESALCMLAAVEKALSELTMPKKEWN